jgi:hypothetical protein
MGLIFYGISAITCGIAPNFTIMIILYALNGRARDSWSVRPEWLSDSLFCFLVLASNPLLDVFFGYTPVLWPLYLYSVVLRMGLDVHIGETSTLTRAREHLLHRIRFKLRIAKLSGLT